MREIEANEYNLNIPRYIDSSEPEDIQDLGAHLQGGIPQRDIDALEEYWRVFPTLRRSLFRPTERDGYSEALVQTSEVKGTILNHPEFKAFAGQALRIYESWRDAHAGRLNGLAVGDDPKGLIADLAEDLLARFATAELLDKYRIYQLLLDYWAETMEDDVYLISQDGWAAGSALRELVVQKGNKSREVPDLIMGRKKVKADLIPPALLVARYFAAEQDEIERLQTQKEGIEPGIGGAAGGAQRRGRAAGGSDERSGQSDESDRHGAFESDKRGWGNGRRASHFAAVPAVVGR